MRTFIATVTVQVYDAAEEDVIKSRIAASINLQGEMSCIEVELEPARTSTGGSFIENWN